MKRFSVHTVDQEDNLGENVKYDEVRRHAHELHRLSEDVVNLNLDSSEIQERLLMIVKSLLGEH